jgi:hypothetical protein
VGSDGTVYYGYSDGTGEPRIAVSRDRGAHWTPSVDVGIPAGIHNSEFAEVIAGDGDRAAFAFLGTPTRGSDQPDGFGKSADGKSYTGATWHLYVATTYDRGAHWTLVDGTPKDPVQRGCIWNGGGSNPCRNLLDFNDITIDREGRVLVAYTDGCAGRCLTDPTYLSGNFPGGIRNPAVIREDCGRGLYAAYDAMTTCSAAVTKPVEVTPSPKRPGLATTGGNLVWAFGGVLAAALLLGVRRVRRRF